MLLTIIPQIYTPPPAYISYQNNYTYHTSGVDVVCFKSNPPFLKNVDKFPDLKQHDIKGCEEYYCGPVSLANGIIHLSQNGYPNLIQTIKTIETIHVMANYLHTDSKGTTTDNLCKGLKNIFKDSGYTYKSIEYQGNRAVDAEFSKGVLTPNITSIKNAIDQKEIVLLNIGIYNKKGSNYQRKWGHWVTVVGYGHDGNSKNPDALIIQDPYKKSKGNSYFTLKKLTEGKLLPAKSDNEITLNQKANGYYQINSNIDYLEKDEIPILNGVVALEM